METWLAAQRKINLLFCDFKTSHSETLTPSMQERKNYHKLMLIIVTSQNKTKTKQKTLSPYFTAARIVILIKYSKCCLKNSKAYLNK